jgi:peptidoglycan/LPS O-acetylase OafA/YrhL
MDLAVSRKIDAFRFLAALAVVACHASQLAYTGPGAGALIAYGRLGVIAFFVLSGFVIAYVCQTKHRDWSHYLVARLARLHSVLVPALLLTWLADAAGAELAPALYRRFPSPWDPAVLAQAPLFPAFLYESFGLGLRWLSNGPLWSIAYEFWYYALFGAATFLRPAARWPILAIALVLAGWKILLLFPLWLIGVVLYRRRGLVARMDPALARSCGLAGIAALLALCSPSGWAMLAGLRAAGIATFGNSYSAFVLWDLVLVAPIAMVLVAVLHPGALVPGARAGAWMKRLADGTFSIYCFHVPLLLLLRATGLYDPARWIDAAAAAVLVVFACLLLSFATERRKSVWTRLWARILRVPQTSAAHGH